MSGTEAQSQPLKMRWLATIVLVICSTSIVAQWAPIESHPLKRFKTSVELWSQIIAQGNFDMDTFEVYMPRYDFQCGAALRKQFVPGKYKFQIEIFTSKATSRSATNGAIVTFTDGSSLDYPDAMCIDYGIETLNNYVISSRIDVLDDIAELVCNKRIYSVTIGDIVYYAAPSESKRLIKLNQVIWNRTGLKP